LAGPRAWVRCDAGHVPQSLGIAQARASRRCDKPPRNKLPLHAAACRCNKLPLQQAAVAI